MSKHLKTILFILPLMVGVFLFTGQAANAAPAAAPAVAAAPAKAPAKKEVTKKFNLPTGISKLNRFKGISSSGDGGENVRTLIGRLAKFMTSIIGTIALLVLIYAGVLWMVAAGNSQREDQAKDIMYWAVLGIFAMLGSYAVLSFIIENALPALTG